MPVDTLNDNTGRRGARTVERFEQAVMDHAEAGGAMSPSYELRPAKEELDAARAALLARLEAAEAVCEALSGQARYVTSDAVYAAWAVWNRLNRAEPAALADAMRDDRPAGGEVTT